MYIFDLDNTLCDAEHRSHLAREKKWDEFHSLALKDDPTPIINIYEALVRDSAPCVILTGRPEKYRALTENWFIKQDLPLVTMVMRADDDFRPDHEFKLEVVKRLITTMHRKQWVRIFEDRDSVVKALRAEGYTVLQVRESLY